MKINDCIKKSTFWFNKENKDERINDLFKDSDLIINKYLERRDNELEAKFIERRKIAVFNPYLKNLVGSFVDKVFQQNVTIETDDLWLKEKEANFDGFGRTLTGFAKDFFLTSEKLSEGYCLIDKSAGIYDADGNLLNKDLKTYNIILDNNNILHTRVQDDILTYIRFKEFNIIEKGFDDIIQTIVKEIYLKNGSVYFNKYQDQGDGEFIQVIEEQPLFLNEIPLIDLYPNGFKQKFQVDKLWSNIADLNISHLNYYSNYLNLSKNSSIQILFAKKLGLENDEIRYGTGAAIHSEESDADMKIVEGSGQSLSSTLETVKKIENDINAFGLNVNVNKTGNATATQSAIDEAIINSILTSHSISLKQALEKIIDKMLIWENKENVKYSININTEYNVKADATQLQALNDLKDRNVISDKEYLNGYKSAGYLREDFDYKEDQLFKDDELSSMLNLETFNIDDVQ